jgi:predicted Rossmann fold nucleotide-binding protein DprA/Smf involved in DNA uptake
VLICGDRNWTNWKTTYTVVKKLILKYGDIFIIEGGARGADTIAKNAAIYFKQQYQEYPANWDKYGKYLIKGN